MKLMKNLIVLLALFSITFFNSCSKDDDIKVGNEFDLKLEQTLTFKEGGFDLELINVADSRCPPNMDCLWPGAGVIDIRIIDGEDAITTIQLSTNDNYITNTVNYGGFTFELIDLLPYPGSFNLNSSEYTAVLKITN